LAAIAEKSLERKTGARGLRAILEDIMLDIMYKLPSLPGVTECVITDDVINKREEPLLVYGNEAQALTG
jgi:ATP-dependent Clp protease ATP-binding subunit ClpX